MSSYTSLICDVDGTLIPNRRDGMPSQKVIDAIANIKDRVHVGIATSRPMFMLDHIIEKLSLSGLCITTGGTQIYDPMTKKIVWEQRLDPTAAQCTIDVLKLSNHEFFINDGGEEQKYSETHPLKTPLSIFVDDLSLAEDDVLFKKLSVISEISVQRMLTHIPGRTALDITHPLATKQHGVFKVAQLLNISTSEIIGIGDGYNDFPLLMACGFKVAMGNAVDDLKAIADYVAPTVEEDGVAHVIEKFLMEKGNFA